MNERRIKRLQEQIKARIAEVLQREIADREIGMVTITRVELDREFTLCKAYWSVIGDAHQRAHTERALRRARGFIQREMVSTLHTRTVPRLEMVFDEAIAGAARINTLLHELREEREARAPDSELDEAGGSPATDPSGNEPDPDSNDP